MRIEIEWNKINDLYPVHYILCIRNTSTKKAIKFFVSEISRRKSVREEKITMPCVNCSNMNIFAKFSFEEDKTTYEASVAVVDSDDHLHAESKRITFCVQ